MIPDFNERKAALEAEQAEQAALRNEPRLPGNGIYIKWKNRGRHRGARAAGLVPTEMPRDGCELEGVMK